LRGHNEKIDFAV